MARTAVIYDTFEENNETNKKKRKYIFCIQYPDGKEENIEYDEISGQYDVFFGWSWKIDFVKRGKKLQQIVNKMENDGYKVRADQLALFMSCKIQRLILQK